MSSWTDKRDALLAADPALATAYEELEPEYAFATSVIVARRKRGWTQKDLAKAIGTTQSAIARLEGGEDVRLRRMIRICDVLGLAVRIGSVTMTRAGRTTTRTAATRVMTTKKTKSRTATPGTATAKKAPAAKARARRATAKR